MLLPRDIAVAASLGSLIERLARGESPHHWGWTDDPDAAFNAHLRTFLSAPPESAPARPANPWGCAATPHFDPILLRIQSLAKGKPWEGDLWRTLLEAGVGIPPDPIIADFLDRGLCIHTLGHLLLSDSWLWRLATNVDEARLTLGKRRWVDPNVRADQVEEVLHAFPDDEWLLGSLLRLEPSDDAKARVLLTYLPNIPVARRTYHTKAASSVMQRLLPP